MKDAEKSIEIDDQNAAAFYARAMHFLPPKI